MNDVDLRIRIAAVKVKKIPCTSCEQLGTARLDRDYWKVCAHQDSKEMFAGGRYLDLKEEDTPEWCPRLTSKKTDKL